MTHVPDLDLSPMGLGVLRPWQDFRLPDRGFVEERTAGFGRRSFSFFRESGHLAGFPFPAELSPGKPDHPGKRRGGEQKLGVSSQFE
jgi:hypothetical protein